MKKTNCYPLLSRLLHWLMLPLLLIQLAWGMFAAQLPLGFERLVWLSRHKSFGMLLLCLVLIRLLWRLLHVRPSYEQTLSQRQQKTATMVHYSLYLCMLLLPISGWLMASAAKLPPSFFGWFAFPPLLSADESLKELFNQFHTLLVWFFSFLVAIHFAATLYHLIIVKDTIFARISLWTKHSKMTKKKAS
jgi:cytochrome b561